MLDNKVKIINEYIDNMEYRIKEIKQYIQENNITENDDVFKVETFCNNIENDLSSLKKITLETYDELE
ncbi:MAG: hypothetical protein VZS44_10665 [Bacilli bacterium]|nr:hypothetical protein [Bacilli bacterium]